ncbi:hypothetical protein ES703_01404 [subsurface metagenome]|nr:hypothetical protein [bacterium]
MGSNALYFGIELIAVYHFLSPHPCLSVDFYDNIHGYVSCGCGYVLYSNTHGESWYALGDTLLPTKPPWDSVGFHIGSIPRKYHVGEGYYNHFGDWYWDIKARIGFDKRDKCIIVMQEEVK